MRTGVYNSKVLQMLILSPRFFRFVRLLIALLALSSTILLADDFRTPEEQLARKIAAITGPGSVSIDFSNRTSLPKTNFDEIHRVFLTELASLGLHFVPADQAAATIRFSLSENMAGYVWISEISQGTNAPVVTMVSSPRTNSSLASRSTASMTLRKTPLWTQSLRILDAAVIEGNPSHLLVLDTEKIAAYRYQDNHWLPEQSLPILHANAWPRDVRGRLVLQRDNIFDAYLPGVLCRSSAHNPIVLSCKVSDDPWPLGAEQSGLNGFFASTRNYFTGAFTPGLAKQTATVPFYSSAVLPREKYSLGLFLGVDGSVHLLDGITDRNAGDFGWGSNVAAIKSNCGSGWQVLASKSGSDSSDSITAFELPDREPVPASQALEFAGAVTELWASGTGMTAVAVVRNSETEQYEAFRLSIDCAQ